MGVLRTITLGETIIAWFLCVNLSFCIEANILLNTDMRIKVTLNANPIFLIFNLLENKYKLIAAKNNIKVTMPHFAHASMDMQLIKVFAHEMKKISGIIVILSMVLACAISKFARISPLPGCNNSALS